MFNVDISAFGRLAAEASKKNFIEFKYYISKVLEYVKDKLEPIKQRFLKDNKKPVLNEANFEK